MIDAQTSEDVQIAGSPEQRLPPSEPRLDKIIIAIHGIGNQRRSDTIRAVARRFGSRSKPPLPVMPLGFFQIGKVGGEVHVSRLDTSDSDPNDPLLHIGFAEVFWADIPRKVVKEDDTLEETKAWASSVVSRAQATYLHKVKNPQLTPQDFTLAAGVIEEIVEAITVMENLFAVTEKAGIFKFDLASLLRDYIGDVQIVTEFKFYRDQIVFVFHRTMAQIVQRFREMYPGGTPDIYIVAHSEGSVVSFLGLLQAMSCPSVVDPDDPKKTINTNWIQYVRGFMTIGSPIDKHIVLWPSIWTKWKLETHKGENGAVIFNEDDGKERLKLTQRIKWRNYYDFGDPIGFKLETAVEYLKSQKCEAFEFVTEDHDFGFSRYWLPGKAHTDYWDDAEVFGHFIDDVVIPGPPAARPKNRPLRGIIGTAFPYALSFGLHLAAVYLLYKAVAALLEFDAPLERPIFLLSVLLMSITVAARLPRLVKTTGLRWHGAALLSFSVGAVACLYLPKENAIFMGQPLVSFFNVTDACFNLAHVCMSEADEANITYVSKAVLLLAAAIVVIVSWWLPRTPRRGRLFLICSGALVILSIIVYRWLTDEKDSSALWPVVLAGFAFTYLWWLGILLFDLAFIWHRYIRQSVAVNTLREWNRGRDSRPIKTLGKKPA